MAMCGIDPRKPTCFAGGHHEPAGTLVDVLEPWDFRHLHLTRLTSVLAASVPCWVFIPTLTTAPAAPPTLTVTSLRKTSFG